MNVDSTRADRFELLDSTHYFIHMLRAAENCTRWNVLHEAKDFVTLSKIKEFSLEDQFIPSSVFLLLWPQPSPPPGLWLFPPPCGAELIRVSDALPHYCTENMHTSSPSSLIIPSTFYHLVTYLLTDVLARIVLQ